MNVSPMPDSRRARLHSGLEISLHFYLPFSFFFQNMSHESLDTFSTVISLQTIFAVNMVKSMDTSSWKISFLTCHRVAYETDATWRGIAYVREMKKPQLGYYGQDITLNESKEFDGFYDVSMDLTILTAKAVFLFPRF